MSKTATTPREKSKLVTKTVTPQQANVSLATNASISQDEEADDGLFVDVDSLQVHNFYCLNFFSPLIFKIQSKKTSKRHQLSMTFPCVSRFLTKKTSTFDDFSLCF